MVISALYTVVDLIYYEQLKWIRDSVKPSVLLNFEIVSQVGAINAQDSLNASINQLSISQAFFQKIIDESYDAIKTKDQVTRDASNFQQYLKQHGDETL